MLAKTALLCYNNYSDKKRVIICVLNDILDVCFSVKLAHSKQIRIEPAVRSLAVPVVAALPLATADRGASFCSLYHPQDALATSPITRSIRGVVIVMRNYF